MKTIKWKLFAALVVGLLIPWGVFQLGWMARVQKIVDENFKSIKQEVGQFNRTSGEKRAKSESYKSRLTLTVWSRFLKHTLFKLQSNVDFLEGEMSKASGAKRKRALLERFMDSNPELVCAAARGGKVVGYCKKSKLSRDILKIKRGTYYSPYGLVWVKKGFWVVIDVTGILANLNKMGLKKGTQLALLDRKFNIYYSQGDNFKDLDSLIAKVGLYSNEELFLDGINRFDFVDRGLPVVLKTIPLNDELVMAVITSGESEFLGAVGGHQFAKYLDSFLKIKSEAISSELLITGIIVMGVVLLGTFMVAVSLSSKVTRPINAIKDRAQKIAKGDLDTVLEIEHDDEIGELARSINEMIKGLKDRDIMKDTLGRAVSPAIFEEIMKIDQKPFLHGEKKDVTILIGDFRGFTEASERMSPGELIGFLNSYFSRFVDTIFKYGGTLDKYLGDGIMVVFGAPVPQENHADQAILVALELLSIVDEFNKERLKDGRDLLDYGIGLNTGEVVAGRIGSRMRFDYTVIGDQVNLAFRTQDMCKQMKTRLLLTENTKEALHNISFPMEFAGSSPIRGKKEPINFYTISEVTNIREHLKNTG